MNKKIKMKKRFQAGYAYGPSWVVCGWGDTASEAREALMRLMSMHAIDVDGARYIEQSTNEKSEVK